SATWSRRVVLRSRFFFSSRRRHTRLVSDWSSDVCSSDLCWYFRHPDLTCWLRGGDTCYAQIGDHRKHGLEPGDCISVAPSDLARSEERRVGKEGRYRWVGVEWTETGGEDARWWRVRAARR